MSRFAIVIRRIILYAWNWYQKTTKWHRSQRWCLFRPHKVDFLFSISRPNLKKTCAFGWFMDILPCLLNLSWPSLFEIEIVSNNFNNKGTCLGSFDSFSNKYLTVPCSFHRFIYANRSCSKTILSIRSGDNYSVNDYGLEIPKRKFENPNVILANWYSNLFV